MQWYETTIGKRRFLLEQTIMGRRFPQFTMEILGDSSCAFVGEIETNLGNRYKVRLKYPSNYLVNPEIKVYFLDVPKRPQIPHLHADYSMCLYKSRADFASNRTTAATYAARAATWLAAYEVWQKTGKWPGRGV